MTKTNIIDEITKYMQANGVRYWTEIYVGITKEPRSRLFNDHNVAEHGDYWIHCPADSSQVARDVEAHFLRLGADGGPGGGDATSDVVYAYKKNAHTEP